MGDRHGAGTTPKALGALLLRRMAARGWTQTELARRSGVNQSYISGLIRGAVERPGEDKARALREALDIGKREWNVAAGLIEADGDAPDDLSPEERQILAELRANPATWARLERARAHGPESLRELVRALAILAGGESQP